MKEKNEGDRHPPTRGPVQPFSCGCAYACHSHTCLTQLPVVVRDVAVHAVIQGATGLTGKPGKQGRDGIPGADVSHLHIPCNCHYSGLT